MPRDGSGNFSRTAGVFTGASIWQNRRDSGDATIYASEHDTHDQDLAQAIADSLSKDGQTVPTANLPMGDFRHTGVGNASARNHYAVVGQIQDGGYIYGGTSTGAANAYDISANLNPAVTVPAVAGMTFRFRAHQTNTAGCVFTAGPNIGAIHIRQRGDSASQLAAGMIQNGQIVEVTYDGTFFRINNPHDAITQSVVQNSAYVWGGTSGGSSSNYTVTLSPAATTFPAGTRIWFIANHTNTGVTSLNVNGLGAAGIGTGWPTVTDLKAGMIQSGQIVDVVYDGLRFLLMNPTKGPFTYNSTASTTGTITAGAILRARYSLDPFAKQCHVEISAALTIAGGDVSFTLPVAAYSADGSATIAACGAATLTDISCVVNGSSVTISRASGMFPTPPATVPFVVNATYEYA